jgi:hypothetical protein
MLLPSALFITDYTQFVSDLYRNENAQHPRLDHVRPGQDVVIFEVNGLKWIQANGNGISLYTTYDTRKNWWKIPEATVLPPQIKLVRDMSPGNDGHYMLAPACDMLLSNYINLLDQLRLHCLKVT